MQRQEPNLTKIKQEIISTAINDINHLVEIVEKNNKMTLSDTLNCIAHGRKIGNEIIKKVIENNQYELVKKYLEIALENYTNQLPDKKLAMTILAHYSHDCHLTDIYYKRNCNFRVMNVGGFDRFEIVIANNEIHINEKNERGQQGYIIPLHDIRALYEAYHASLDALCMVGDTKIIKEFIVKMTSIFRPYDIREGDMDYSAEENSYLYYTGYAVKQLAQNNHFDAIDQLTRFEKYGHGYWFNAVKEISQKNGVWNEDTLLRCLVKHANYAREKIAEKECEKLQLSHTSVLKKAAKLVQIINESHQCGVDIQYKHAKVIMNLPEESRTWLLQGLTGNFNQNDFFTLTAAALGLSNKEDIIKTIKAFYLHISKELDKTIPNKSSMKNSHNENRMQQCESYLKKLS